MPRRLGDDPLARAKSSLVAPDSTGEGVVAPPGSLSSSRAPYNDVFFRRRTREVDTVTTTGPQQPVAEEAPAVPEISEISEFPEIREVAALPEVRNDQTVAAVTEAEPAPENAPQAAESMPALADVATESAEADGPNLPVADLGEQDDAVPDPAEGAVVVAPVVSQPLSRVEEQQPEPKATNGDGGLLKRLFGRLGK